MQTVRPELFTSRLLCWVCSLGSANSIKMSLRSLLHNEPLLTNSNQTSMNLQDRNRKVGYFLFFFLFFGMCIISFLTLESSGSAPFLQARMRRSRHAGEGLFRPCLVPSQCPPSKYPNTSVSSWRLHVRPAHVQESRQRVGFGETLSTPRAQAAFPRGLFV